MLFKDIDEGPLDTLFWFFKGPNDYEDDPTDQTRALILELDLQVTHFFSLLADSPFTLVALGDEARDISEKLQTADTFKRKHRCCKEPNMEEKLDDAYPTADALAHDREFQLLMQNWAKIGEICSMQVERLIAAIKASTEHKRPNLERLCASGFLAEWHAAHMTAGGRDSKYHTVEDLVQAGAPLNAASAGKRERTTPNAGRGHIEYSNEKYTEVENANGGKLPRARMLDLKRRFSAEYWVLPAAEQQCYEEAARNKLTLDLDLPPQPDDVEDYDRNRKGVLWGGTPHYITQSTQKKRKT